MLGCLELLVYANWYMGWAEVSLMLSGKSRTACDTLWNWFWTYSAPEEILSDRGPLFDSEEYNVFLDNEGIRKCTSSAYYPQSNGRVELAVKEAKQTALTAMDTRSLLTHYNTAIQDLGISPTIMMYDHVIKDQLPALQDKYWIHKQWGKISQYRKTAM